MTAEELAVVEFVRARFADDELWARFASGDVLPSCARVAHQGAGDRWHWEDTTTDQPVQPDWADEFLNDGGRVSLRSLEEYPTNHVGPLPHMVLDAEEVDAATAGHIVRHHPARVLRSIAARRPIVDRFAYLIRWPADQLSNWQRGERAGLYAAVMSFAAEYSDHEDFGELLSGSIPARAKVQVPGIGGQERQGAQVRPEVRHARGDAAALRPGARRPGSGAVDDPTAYRGPAQLHARGEPEPVLNIYAELISWREVVDQYTEDGITLEDVTARTWGGLAQFAGGPNPPAMWPLVTVVLPDGRSGDASCQWSWSNLTPVVQLQLHGMGPAPMAAAPPERSS